MTSRPARLVVITGTGTEVGKTWFGAATLAALREQGVAVAARKPVQSFEPGAGPTDADVLAAATGEAVADVCPDERSVAMPVAPPMAAELLGRDPFTIADLVAELSWPASLAVGLVEGVGGPRSPLASDGDTVDLVAALHPDLVVVVAEAGLGAINAVRLSIAPFDDPVVVALNRFDAGDDLHRRNRMWLAERYGFDVATSPEELATRLAPS